MKFIGNFIDWLPNGILQSLEQSDGEIKQTFNIEKLSSHPKLYEYIDNAKNAYSDGKFCYQEYRNFEINLDKLPEQRKHISYWIVKLLPGQIQFVYPDQYVYGINNAVRYTMFLSDWERGHILSVKDEMPSEYKAGDLYRWDDALVENGSINIGYTTMYFLNIEMHD